MPVYPVEGAETQDKRRIVVGLVFPLGVETTYVGVGDDLAAGVHGGGSLFTHQQTGIDNQEIEVRFIDNRWFAGARMMSEGAVLGDHISARLVAPASPATLNGAGAGNANKVPLGGGLNLFMPAPGNGAWDLDLEAALNPNVEAKTGEPSKITAVTPVPAKNYHSDGVVDSAGFYDYDRATGAITEKPDQDGCFNLFDQDLELTKWIDKIALWGPGGNIDHKFGEDVSSKMVLPHWKILVNVETLDAASDLKLAFFFFTGKK